jgi:Abnormal spindle-like microcephaly-assoc'd, ASPM-SPD-2-Hydin
VYSFLTSTAGYTTGGAHNNSQANPAVTRPYCNGSRIPPEAGLGAGWQVPPGISDATVPNPPFNLTPVVTVDEGNNWINISWGPLALMGPLGQGAGTTPDTMLGIYTPASVNSPTVNYIPSTGGNNGNGGPYRLAPDTDFFGNPRKTNNAVDAGAVEFVAGPATAILSVTGGPVSFGNQATGTTSASQTLTLHNTGTAGATGITVAVATTTTPTTPNQFARLGGSCGATLAAGGNCTITVTFSPTTTGAKTGTVTITANVGVTGSPVALSGTGVAPVIAATLTPTSWTTSATRGCGLLTCPVQMFTLTNTGNVNLTGIGQGALGGTNASEFSILRFASTCGPAGGGQLLGQTTLAPGAACVVTVRFTPLTTQTTGVKNATVSVTDLAGTQTSTLTGTAN